MKIIKPTPIPPMPLPDDHPLKAVELLHIDYSDVLIIRAGDDEDRNEAIHKAELLAFNLTNALRRHCILLFDGEKIEAISKKELRKLLK